MKTLAYLGILLLSSVTLFAQTKPLAKPVSLSHQICLPVNPKGLELKKTNLPYTRSIHRMHAPAIDNENQESKLLASSNSAVAEIKAFPNPFTTQIDVIITDGAMSKSVYKAIMFDLNGRKVHTETISTNQYSMQLSHLSTGVYFLNIEKNGVLLKQERFVKE